MARTFRHPSVVKLPQRNRETHDEKTWHETKGITECPKCKNVRYKKQWYASKESIRPQMKDGHVEISDERLCPACVMAKEGVFEGEVFIEGFPGKEEENLMNLVRAFGERATEIDPQDRIIRIESTREGYRVTTTEDQLANKIAKKIKDTFHPVTIDISHAPEPHEVSRVHVRYLTSILKPRRRENGKGKRASKSPKE